MHQIVLIAHNLRSTYNVGSLLRTADGLGVYEVFFTGYTPYPRQKNETRLPHLARKIDNQIAKTALGAEKTVKWQHLAEISPLIDKLRKQKYQILALEQGENAVKLPDFSRSGKVAMIVGREVEGIEPEVLELCDEVVEIPMLGQKESFNVVQAAAMALYHLRFMV